MDPLYNPLGTRPIQTGREMSMEPYPNRQFGFIDNPDRQSGSGSVPTRTRTRSDGPDPLLTLVESYTQAGRIESSGQMMIVSSSIELSLLTSKYRASARSTRIVRPGLETFITCTTFPDWKVGNFYQTCSRIVYSGQKMIVSSGIALRHLTGNFSASAR